MALMSCSSAGLRFPKGADQRPQPSSLLNGLGGPFPVRVVAVPAAARGARAKAAMKPAAGSAWDHRALTRRSRPGLSAAFGDLGHSGGTLVPEFGPMYSVLPAACHLWRIMSTADFFG